MEDYSCAVTIFNVHSLTVIKNSDCSEQKDSSEDGFAKCVYEKKAALSLA